MCFIITKLDELQLWHIAFCFNITQLDKPCDLSAAWHLAKYPKYTAYTVQKQITLYTLNSNNTIHFTKNWHAMLLYE